MEKTNLAFMSLNMENESCFSTPIAGTIASESTLDKSLIAYRSKIS